MSTKPIMHKITGTEEEAVTMLGLYQFMPALVAEAKAAPNVPEGEVLCSLLVADRGWALVLSVIVPGQGNVVPLLTIPGKTPKDVLSKLVAQRSTQAGKHSNN